MSSVPQRHLVRLAMPPGVPPLALLRTQLATCLPDLDEDLLADLQLVATELVTNAYLHGAPPVEFTLLELGAPGGALRLEVSDRGTELPRTRQPEPSQPHGRGLLLVGASAARWGVVEAAPGKTVWAEFGPRGETRGEN